VYVYVDTTVSIVREKGINNGQPSVHAKWIASAAINEGDHVVHVGTGTGYYTAIMAHLVGSSGRVTGIEFDPTLATRAKVNLASYSHVQIIEGDGTLVPQLWRTTTGSIESERTLRWHAAARVA